MNTSSFSPHEKLLMIRALNHRVIENYNERLLFEKKKNFNKYVKPVNSALEKLTTEDQKLTRFERIILSGCINEMRGKVNDEEGIVLLDCRKRLRVI